MTAHAAPISAFPGGPCLCGRGETIGTCTWTSTRMHFRSFRDGPANWHHEEAVHAACQDCVADTAVAVASGAVDEEMRRIFAERQPWSAVTP